MTRRFNFKGIFLNSGQWWGQMDIDNSCASMISTTSVKPRSHPKNDIGQPLVAKDFRGISQDITWLSAHPKIVNKVLQ